MKNKNISYFAKAFVVVLVALVGTMSFSSCNSDETYAEQKEKERDAIASFLKRDVKITDGDGNVLCDVGVINVISESQFIAQDSTTDVSKNEYVLFNSSGVYMQIVRKGAGERMKPGDSRYIAARFLEFNILSDTIQARSTTNFWAPSPDIMLVKNTSGTFSGTFDTSVNGGGLMSLEYHETSVPAGWLVPFSYIRVGRQTSADEGIAKVRLIVPHAVGTNGAMRAVYPCFYELLFQQLRD